MSKQFHFLNLDLPISDTVLLKFLQAKDEKAFQYLYDNHAPLLYGQIIKMVPDVATAEVALSATFKKIWQTAEQFDASRSRLLLWMLHIARACTKELIPEENAEINNVQAYSNAS